VGESIGDGGVDWSNIVGKFWSGEANSVSRLGRCGTALREWCCVGSVVCMPDPIESDVSCGCSGWIGEEWMESGVRPDRRGGASDTNGGE
jgi:hypothetical protein